MKKFYLILCGICASLGLMAQTFTEDLVVSINGVSTPPQQTSFSVQQNPDGTYCFRLDNFVLGADEDMIPVGNIVLTDVEGTTADGITTIATTQVIRIAEGTDESLGSFWLGPLLEDVPIVLTGKFNDEHMYCHIDIDMTQTALEQMILVDLGDADLVTSISRALTDAASETVGIYTLDGRRIQHPAAHGVYIIGGHKVVR